MSVLGRAAPFLTGKFIFALTASAGTVDLRTAALAAGWDGTSPVVATVPAGINICPSTYGTTGLTISGSFPSGVRLEIAATGGIGGGAGATSVQGVGAQNGNPGGAGGLALAVSTAVTIYNLGTIAGGGGGGGSGAGALRPDLGILQGGGGGNGQSLVVGFGVGGTGDVGYGGTYAGNGGTGGGLGSAGSGGGNSVSWDVWPGGYSGGASGAAGGCLTGNGSIIWEATGTRIGSIS